MWALLGIRVSFLQFIFPSIKLLLSTKRTIKLLTYNKFLHISHHTKLINIRLQNKSFSHFFFIQSVVRVKLYVNGYKLKIQVCDLSGRLG